jgi:3',5'-nucleoside bisphosphate phosphatase
MIDLHTHSTASDGTRTPAVLMELASSCGITAIALTDHDTLSGLAEAGARADALGLRFIPGVEVEIERDGGPQDGEFHLLGLGLHGNRGPLEDALRRVRKARTERNLRMVEKLSSAGLPVTMEELSALARGEVLSRAHFARLLSAKGIVSSTEQAFSRYLGKGAPFYEPRRCLGLGEAAELIAGAGGLPVIAHPASLKLAGPALEGFLSRCRDLGVAGLEAWHPTHTLKQCRTFARIGRRLGLALTGGSDFHGENMPHRVLGRAAKGREIPEALLAGLALRARER